MWWDSFTNSESLSLYPINLIVSENPCKYSKQDLPEVSIELPHVILRLASCESDTTDPHEHHHQQQASQPL